MANVNGDKQTTVKLRRPIKMPDGSDKTELSIDVDGLTWADLHNLELEYSALFPGQTPTNGVYFTDTKYQSLLIARINGMVYDQIQKVSARDSFTLSTRLGRFLSEELLEQHPASGSSTEGASAPS